MGPVQFHDIVKETGDSSYQQIPSHLTLTSLPLLPEAEVAHADPRTPLSHASSKNIPLTPHSFGIPH